MSRSAGILLHVTSLPSRFGVGDFGPEADRFVDWLAEAGFGWWQMLPLNPPGYGWSPYQPWSAFAGNPLLISPELLVADGLLTTREIEGVAIIGSTSRAEFSRARELRRSLLLLAFERFEPDDGYRTFLRENGEWLEDAVLFDVIHRRQEKEWTAWDTDLRDRDPEALDRVRREEWKEIELGRFTQYLFGRQHERLRTRANERGIRLIGDLPIFVAHDSADVWGNRQLFDLEENGEPRVVAGVPPDYFSPTGQRWGNPLYRWERMATDDYSWWISRLAVAFSLFDSVRLDHFRGFESYWEVPASEPDATGGNWAKGPGLDFFGAVAHRFGHAPILAEDLGDITPEVDRLREATGFPGMAVLQFGPPDPTSPHLPHNFPDSHRVVYTGTHDNDTAVGWWRSLPRPTRAYMRRYIGLGRLGRRKVSDVAIGMRRLAYRSIADLAIVPMQDLLGLGSEGRMNRPGSLGEENWRWRMERGDLDLLDPESIRLELETFGRDRRDPDADE